MKKKRSIMHSIAAAPHIFWAALFIILPRVIVVFYAFTDESGAFTLANLGSLKHYSKLFGLSLELSVLATFVCFLVGYPLAYIIARAPRKHQKFYMMLLMLPMWTNLLIRTYSIMAILDDGGFLNQLLNTELHIIGTKGAVIFGMVYDFLPYMVLPIYTCISKIDKNMWEAASDLGCNGFQVITKVIFPLSLSGVISGITMVFVPSISTFYISQKLGGPSTLLIGDVIEQSYNASNYHLTAALSFVLMIILLIGLAIMNKYTDADDGGMLI